MRPQDLEPEMEALLSKLVPDLAEEWEGATDEEIERIEALAGRPLPRFYRWFLMRMGASMGPIAYPMLDFSATRVLSCYAEGLFAPSPRFLMIGYESDDMRRLHTLYDFDHPARDDARVSKGCSTSSEGIVQFDTFREMIAWGKFSSFRVCRMAQRCIGTFEDHGGDVLSHLDPVMKSLGFESPVPTGRCCSLYDGPDAALITSITPRAEPRLHIFRLGGKDPARLRRILGEIATETSLELEIDEWNPRLPA